MPKGRKANSGTTPPSTSLLSPESTGGIVAGVGLDFQLRYVACHLPLWLRQGEFHQLLFEGTGDIDIRFSNDSGVLRRHIQIKDHEVAPAELKATIEQFERIDAGMKGTYATFTLACPSLSARVRPVEAALARFRDVKPFYDDVPHALVATKEEVVARLNKLGLGDYLDFILSKVNLDIGHGDLRFDERAIELFISRLLEHPEYAGKVRAMVAPAFAEVTRAISARRGVTWERRDIELMLQAAVRSGTAETPGVTIWVQNWTNESFDREADYILDWSRHFDRSTRRVPSMDTWNEVLVPELRALRARIGTERTERLVRFRGKCALSTGLAIGATFPLAGGWTFEVPQPPSPDHWRSDAQATTPYELQAEVTSADAEGTDLVLGINVKGDGRNDVRLFVESEQIHPRLFAFVAPPTQGDLSIRGSEDACAFALSMRQFLGELRKQYGIAKTHIFFYGPLALSIFIAQRLTSVGEIQAYEYQDPGFVPSCTLRS